MMCMAGVWCLKSGWCGSVAGFQVVACRRAWGVWTGVDGCVAGRGRWVVEGSGNCSFIRSFVLSVMTSFFRSQLFFWKS